MGKRRNKRNRGSEQTKRRELPEALRPRFPDRRIVGVLEELSDFESQRRYKNAVPFVHIPHELGCQFANICPGKARGPVFEALVPYGPLRERLRGLGELLDTHFDTCPRRHSDVPEVQWRVSWKRVQQEAREVLAFYLHGEWR